MFEELLREIGRLKQTRVSVDLPLDADGYLDRACPSSECGFEFKVHQKDWRDRVRDEEVFCPFCGHSARSDQWSTAEQVKYAEKAALAQVERRIGSAMERDAARWNRQQPANSFIRMTMKVQGRPRHFALPVAAAERMQLKLVCPTCDTRYAVIGAAFFCPACGHNAAELVFEQSLASIRNVMDALGSIYAAMPDRDSAENTSRLIIENSLQNAVTAFQRYVDALYQRHPGNPKPPRNAFQSLQKGSDLWGAAFGKGYATYLTETELAYLQRCFQQRHLLAHREGLVDEEYIARCGDTTYRPGQRLVVRETGVKECLNLVEKLAGKLRADASES